MRNFLYNFNQTGLSLTPEHQSSPSPAEQGFARLLLHVVITGIAVSLFSQGFLFLLRWISDATELPFYAPLPATIAWILISRFAPALFRFFGISVGVGAGIPLGFESAVFGFNKAINPLFGSNVLLYHCGTVAAIAACFGTPLVAICLALELLLSEWTIRTVIPVLLAAAIGTLCTWLFQGGIPLFTITVKEPVTWSVGLAIGLLIGLWSAATISLTKVFKRWIGTLANKSHWWLLIPAVIASLICFYSPNHITNLNGYMDDLLQARVTLFLLFALGILNWLTWCLYNAGFGTGAGILPLLLNGGAWALFAGLLIQLSVPSLKLDAVFMVLLGMTAMFAAGSRALVTALVLGLELSRSFEFILPGAITCITAYSLSYLLAGKQRSSLNAPAL